MWAKLKKTSLDHVRKHSRDEEHEQDEQQQRQAVNDAVEEEESRDVPTEMNEGHHHEKKSYERSESWAKLQRKVTPVARERKTSREASKEDEWIVEERLKVNFYLDDGVSKWHIIHPVATGSRQSPIDIVTGKAVLDETLKPIQVEYGKGCVKSVVNTGNSFKVDIDDSIAVMRGGALENDFRLIQFHAHWGTTAGAKGSEHTVNGKLYDAELHLVHWNQKYGLFSKAVEHSDGLAVIGIFLEVCEDESHAEFDKVIALFRRIYYRNMKADFDDHGIDPTNFLPDDMSYWYYPGSLTTPPLNESVLWHVLRTPIKISKSQLFAMASLRTGTSKEDDQSCIINNFRPPVPLGIRSVRLFTGERAGGQQNEEQEQAQISSSSVEALTNQLSEMKSLMLELRNEVAELKAAVKNKSSKDNP